MKHRDYRGHIKNATLKKRVCSCTLCNKQFTSGQQLAEHVLICISEFIVVERQGPQREASVCNR